MTRKFMEVFKPEILEIIQKYKKEYNREEMERCPICQGEFCGSDEQYLLLCIDDDRDIYMHTDCAIKFEGFDILKKIKGSDVYDFDLYFQLPKDIDDIQSFILYYDIWEGSLNYHGVFGIL